MSEDRCTLARMIEAYGAVQEAGLLNRKRDNCGCLARVPEESEVPPTAVEPEAIG